MKNELVYSTEGGRKKKQKEKSQGKAYFVGTGPIKLRREKKGRGGKVVTVLSNIPLQEAEAKDLLKQLQQSLACGGTLKGATIELRGDVLDKVIGLLAQKGLKAQQAGG